MRVTHVITRLIVGGAQENTIASVLGLHSKAGCQVDLISGPTSGPEGSLEPLVQAVPGLLTIEPSLVRPIRPFTDFRALSRLAAWFRTQQPDIVHTHSGKAGILGRWAAHRAGVPIILHTIHGPSFGTFQSAPANAFYRAAERFAGRFTNHFIVVANAMRDQYLQAGIGAPEDYTRIFSGFNLAPFLNAPHQPSQRPRLGLQPDDVVIAKLARLVPLKGHEDLFAIAPRLIQQIPRIKFLLIGDGPLRPRLEALARQPPLHGHFLFTGLVAPDRIPGLLAASDLLVHLSEREGLPRALPQALAAGRPVVAYDRDGAGEICITGQTGFLIPPRNQHQLVEALQKLAFDPELRAQLADRGRSLVQEQFSVDNMVDSIFSLYHHCLDSP